MPGAKGFAAWRATSTGLSTTGNSLGFKNPKYVTSMEVTNEYKGGYWEDQGYNSFSGS